MNEADIYNDMRLDDYLCQSDDPSCCMCGGETTYENHNSLDHDRYICDECLGRNGWCEDSE